VLYLFDRREVDTTDKLQLLAKIFRRKFAVSAGLLLGLVQLDVSCLKTSP